MILTFHSQFSFLTREVISRTLILFTFDVLFQLPNSTNSLNFHTSILHHSYPEKCSILVNFIPLSRDLSVNLSFFSPLTKDTLIRLKFEGFFFSLRKIARLFGRQRRLKIQYKEACWVVFDELFFQTVRTKIDLSGFIR